MRKIIAALQVSVDGFIEGPMLTYRARARWEHETTQISVLASSLYVNRDGAWRLVFHQQTPSASRMT